MPFFNVFGKKRPAAQLQEPRATPQMNASLRRTNSRLEIIGLRRQKSQQSQSEYGSERERSSIRSYDSEERANESDGMFNSHQSQSSHSSARQAEPSNRDILEPVDRTHEGFASRFASNTPARTSSGPAAGNRDRWNSKSSIWTSSSSPARYVSLVPGAPRPHAAQGMGTRSLQVRETTTQEYEPLCVDDLDSEAALLRLLDDSNGQRCSWPDALNAWSSIRSEGADFISSTYFHVFVAAMIILNAIIIGFETNDPDAEHWDMFEEVLLVIFSMELAARLVFFGPITLLDPNNPDFAWNIFDMFLITIGLLDCLFDFIHEQQAGRLTHDGHSTGVTSVFRVFRLLRILRIFRLIRFLKKLYILSYGFVLAAIAVFWVSLLMGVVLYVCAIILTRTMGEQDTDDGHAEFWKSHYGKIPLTMFTLFQLMMQPNLVEYQGLLNDRPIFAAFLVGFIIFGSFGMIALLTGVISEAMFEKNQLRLQEERTDREMTRQALLEKCQTIFDEVVLATGSDEDEVPKETLMRTLPRLHETFDTLNLPYTAHDLQDMLEVMDTDGSGTINKSEFCRGILHIAENSEDLRPMLMMELHYDSISFLKSCMSDFKKCLEGMIWDQRKDSEEMRAFLKHGVKQMLKISQFGNDAAGGRKAAPVQELPRSASTYQPSAQESRVKAVASDFASNVGRQDAASSMAEDIAELKMRTIRLEKTLCTRVSAVEAQVKNLASAVMEMTNESRRLHIKKGSNCSPYKCGK